MKLSPYIVVNHVQEALDFYKSTFGGEVIPLNEHQGKLLHAELKIQEDVVLHLSDDYGKDTSNTGAQILLTFNNKETQQRIYDALNVKGNPHMPLNRTFFNAIHGQVTDRYGVNWLLNCFVEE
ncbi:VOC family protein [Staphylococcus chromogenes]|uniref:VOC family protein n=1 Tax=Staphylococcus chromogenes TaxID=46126 RepID=UPI00227CBFE9|nr:VOC family protein [Staphylococcus chromogenes]MDT0694008.1 VOC family protein [Staphylococcus chromogenes]MDU0481877.1 VOC family protein [Staphylococcus chromogenes]MDY3277837.1 VOC family protein [Staphylococcus chromogenes]WAG31185.1 VOC family protein [Staphylococcus chromogenes]